MMRVLRHYKGSVRRVCVKGEKLMARTEMLAIENNQGAKKSGQRLRVVTAISRSYADRLYCVREAYETREWGDAF